MGVFIGPVQSNGKQLVKLYDPWTGEGQAYLWKKEDVDKFQTVRKEGTKKPFIYGLIGAALGSTAAFFPKLGKMMYGANKKELAGIGACIGFVTAAIVGTTKYIKDINNCIKVNNANNQ